MKKFVLSLYFFTLAWPIKAADPTVSDTNWVALNTGLNGIVMASVVSGNYLYVGGEFTIAGSSNVNYIAKWDGVN